MAEGARVVKPLSLRKYVRQLTLSRACYLRPASSRPSFCPLRARALQPYIRSRYGSS
jgi:hypothetical protein